MFKLTSKAVLATALSATLVVAGLASAGTAMAASPKPSPSGSPAASKPLAFGKKAKIAIDAYIAARDDYNDLIDQYSAGEVEFQAVLDGYAAAAAAYANAKLVISSSFSKAIRTANDAFDSNVSEDTTDSQKANLLLQRRTAITKASNSRLAALVALGRALVKPDEAN